MSVTQQPSHNEQTQNHANYDNDRRREQQEINSDSYDQDEPWFDYVVGEFID
jgi:hypothetical protein